MVMKLIDPGQNGLSAIEYGTITALGSTPATFTLVATFAGSPVIAPVL